MYSIFDSFFAPPRVIVVSEERLKQVERDTKEKQLKTLDQRIEELTKYRTSLDEEIKNLTPTKEEATCDV